MLDVAEEILFTAGPDALTVEAIIAGAQSSTGSFYARFENREGLLLALHHRFLERTMKEMAPILGIEIPKSTLVEELIILNRYIFGIVERNRKAFFFFVVHNSFDQQMREDALPMLAVIRGLLESTIEKYRDEWSRTNSSPDFDYLWLIAYGVFLNTLLYREDNLHLPRIEVNEIAEKLARTICNEL